MGMSGVRNLKVWAALLMAALAASVLMAVVLAAPAQAAPFSVTNTADSGEGSLRQAISDANASAGEDTINFDPSLLGQTITLSSQQLTIADSAGLIIDGGSANITVSGNNAVRVFEVRSGAKLTLNNLTVANGRGASGGAISNRGTVTVTNSTLSGNSAPSGGGIYDGATATLKNTIVANSPPGGNCYGTYINGGYNLDSDGSCGFGTINHSLSGTTDNPLNPQLGSLANNGGPTLTHALLAGSPAIDKGNSFGATTDQRGVSRPLGAASDIGAFEAESTIIEDTIKPRVSTATPTGPEIGRGTNVAATFSEKMSPTSITNSTFKLYKVTSSGTTQVTNVTVTLSSDGPKATLNPYGTSSTLLAARTKYKAVVTTGAKDLAGNALDQNSTTAGNQQKSWTFTTKG